MTLPRSPMLRMDRRYRCCIWTGMFIILLMCDTSEMKKQQTREERRQYKATLEENTALKAKVKEFEECQLRVNELEYHNNALRMISKKQIPTLEEDTQKAVGKLKLAIADEARWRLTFTVSFLGFVISASVKTYGYFRSKITENQKKFRQEKAKQRTERRRR